MCYEAFAIRPIQMPQKSDGKFLAQAYLIAMRALVRARVISVAGAILFARSLAADDWPCCQHDVQHTGDSSAVVNPQALAFAWTAAPRSRR